MPNNATSEKLKKIIIDIYKEYPQYVCSGNFEKEFGKKEAERIIRKMNNDELIQVDYNIENDIYYYEFTRKGMDFAMANINLNLSQKIILFTRILVGLGAITILFMAIQLFFQMYG